MHVGLQALADDLRRAGLLERAVDGGADLDDVLPARHGLGVERVGGEGLVHVVEHHVARVVLGGVRHGEPDLIAGEGEDGREELGKGREREVERGLGTAALGGVRRLAVQAVLHNIEVEARERGDAEIVDRVGDDVELVVVVGLLDLFDQLVELGDEPAVEHRHILGLGEVRGVKVHQVIEHELAGVAELEIVLAELLEDGLGAAHIRVIVGARRPQTQNVRTVLVENVGGIDAVAEALVHRAALAVHGPAVGDALLEGSALTERAHGGQQGGLEPAAVLVEALEVHRGGPEALIFLHRGEVRGAGVEPAVERVLLLGEAGALAAVRAGEALGQNVGGVHLEPGVGAFLGKEGGNSLDGLVGADRLAAVGAVEHGNGQTPATLTADAPVGALTDHALHAVDAPARDPAHVVARGAGLVLKGIDGAEPLRGGAEDDGLLAAPAMRIAVHDFLGSEEGAGLLHIVEDDGVGLLHEHSLILAGIVGVAALIVDGHDHIHAVAAAGLIVVRAEAGRGVDAARTGIHRDIIGEDQTAGLGQERMLREHILIEVAGVGLDDGVVLDLANGHDLLDERLGDDVHFAVVVVADDGVALVGMQRDGEVAGQRPDRGRPNDEAELALIEMAELAEVVVHRELDVHGRAGVVLIFDLRLGQRRLVVIAPVYGLEALVDVALLVHCAEDLDLLGLKAGIHGLVGVLPVAEHADALEALHLDADVLVGILVAGGAEVGNAHGLAVELLLLDDGALDGHTVVVPAGDIGRVVAAHRVGAGDEVLEGLVERVAHVQSAVGERRAVVQSEAGLALVLLEHHVVEVHFLPMLEHLRLALGKPRAHREAGLRHIQRRFVIHVVSPLCDFFCLLQNKNALSPDKRDKA